MSHPSVVVNARTLGPLGLLRELAHARRAGPVPETVFWRPRPFFDSPELEAIDACCEPQFVA